MLIPLDIETVPNDRIDPDSPYTAAVAAYDAKRAALREAGPKPVPRNLTDPAKIAAAEIERRDAWWADLNALDEGRQAALADAWETEVKRRSLDPLWGRVVCIAVGDRDLTAWRAEDEAPMLDELAALLAPLPHGVGLLGWNIDGFDLPFLYARSLLLGSRLAAVLAPALNAKPWERPTVDLMRLWPVTSHGAARFPRQAHIAAALGLPAQTSSGADVYAQYVTGDLAAIVDHCRADVREVVEIARRMGIADSQEVPRG